MKELVRVEKYFRSLAVLWLQHGARSDADDLVTLMDEYDRRGAVEIDLNDRLAKSDRELERLRADLAREPR